MRGRKEPTFHGPDFLPAFDMFFLHYLTEKTSTCSPIHSSTLWVNMSFPLGKPEWGVSL